MLKREVAVELMKHLVNHDWHGYSQYSRWGDGEGTCGIEVGGKVYQLEQGDRDCSSAIISAKSGNVMMQFREKWYQKRCPEWSF